MKRVSFIILALTLVLVVSVSCAKEEKAKEEKAKKQEVIKQEKKEVQKPEAEKEVRAYVMDFDSGAKPSNVGGDFGSWDKDPADFSQSCIETFDPIVKHDDSGFSMRIDYDVDSPNPAYNGFWGKLNNFDASKFKSLVIWTKGDAESGYTKVFKVELKSSPQERSIYYITNVTDQWTKHTIPLDKFSGNANLSSLSEFVIVFEDRIATQKEGTIWIDDIYFIK